MANYSLYYKDIFQYKLYIEDCLLSRVGRVKI